MRNLITSPGASQFECFCQRSSLIVMSCKRRKRSPQCVKINLGYHPTRLSERTKSYGSYSGDTATSFSRFAGWWHPGMIDTESFALSKWKIMFRHGVKQKMPTLSRGKQHWRESVKSYELSEQRTWRTISQLKRFTLSLSILPPDRVLLQHHEKFNSAALPSFYLLPSSSAACWININFS